MVTSNRGGTLYVDGKSCGQLPLQNGIRLKAEQHSVRVVTSGGKRQDAKVVVEAERAKNVPFEF